jgi:hypothetical protein
MGIKSYTNPYHVPLAFLKIVFGHHLVCYARSKLYTGPYKKVAKFVLVGTRAGQVFFLLFAIVLSRSRGIASFFSLTFCAFAFALLVFCSPCFFVLVLPRSQFHVALV